ncbi:O-antigen ligase family protein [Aquisalibacillus elongatus]|uniref:O-antigen ligase n=1 Tax=Aquisalibacillus elongatus TaxID=485577 RepID=A0A3N5BFX1_9BACI|nr:O-antigen ligase family protein [Aquisalibacillus elongatus]RPF54180.1 O-antigen ligase [Aquisalibacillus elongatus]
MLSNQLHNKINYILGFLLFYLLLFNTLGLMTFEPFRQYGRITDHWTLYITVIILLYLFIQQRGLDKNYLYIYIGISLISISYIITHLYNQNFLHDTTLAYQLLSFAFILALMKINWTKEHILVFGYTALIITILYLTHWIIEGRPTEKYIGFFTNTNVLGVFLFSILYFQVIAIKPSHILLKLALILGSLANVLLIYVSTTRSLLLCIVVILASMGILKLSKKIFSLLFYFIMAFNFIFVIAYIWLDSTKYKSGLNEWSQEQFSKNFFSGRENIWVPSIEHFKESPIVGHFVGIRPVDFMEGTHYVHTHNIYLQTLLESGIIGFLSFIVLLYFIWKTYLKNLDSNIVQWSASFFLALLIYQSIGISFFQNIPSIGFLHWLIISIGVSLAAKRTG